MTWYLIFLETPWIVIIRERKRCPISPSKLRLTIPKKLAKKSTKSAQTASAAMEIIIRGRRELGIFTIFATLCIWLFSLLVFIVINWTKAKHFEWALCQSGSGTLFPNDEHDEILTKRNDADLIKLCKLNNDLVPAVLTRSGRFVQALRCNLMVDDLWNTCRRQFIIVHCAWRGENTPGSLARSKHEMLYSKKRREDSFILFLFGCHTWNVFVLFVLRNKTEEQKGNDCRKQSRCHTHQRAESLGDRQLSEGLNGFVMEFFCRAAVAAGRRLNNTLEHKILRVLRNRFHSLKYFFCSRFIHARR